MPDEEKPRGLVIHLFGEPPEVEGTPETTGSARRCWPHAPLIDNQSRLVTCKRCNRQLDPVDVLLQVADRYDDYLRISTETSTMRKQLEELRAEEKRIKARMAAHSRKDAVAAVAEERERWQKRLYEIATRTAEVSRACKRIDQLIGVKRRS